MTTTYPADVKQKVADLVSSGISIREASRRVNVRTETVRGWVAKAKTAVAPARNLLAEKLADDGELAKLRRENSLLKQLVATLLGE